MTTQESSGNSKSTEGRIVSFWFRHEELEQLERDSQANGLKRNANLRRLVREHATG
jgi:hypothetical protein